MKSVLISIQPKWVEKIVNKEKNIEVRKTRPKIETPFKCYIYCTKDKRLLCKFDKGEDCYGDVLKEPLYVHSHCWINDNIVGGKVIGEFICDRIEIFKKSELGIKNKDFFTLAESCVKVKEMREYIGKNKIAYAWHISDLKIYDKPKELGEFFTPMGKIPSYMIERPPQSWQYVEEL